MDPAVEANHPVNEIPVERLGSVDVPIVWEGRIEKGFSLLKHWQRYQRLVRYSAVMARREPKYRVPDKMW